MDLVGVTEKLASYVKVPDAGLVGGTPESGTGVGGQVQGYRDPGSASGIFGSVDGGLNLGKSTHSLPARDASLPKHVTRGCHADET